MLYNLPLLSIQELQLLFNKESSRFMEGLEKKIAFNELNEIKFNLKAISTELDKRSGTIVEEKPK